MIKWFDVDYEYHDLGMGKGCHCAVFEFKDEGEAHEFVRLAKIAKDVDIELLHYGDGVLRTMSRGKKLNRRGSIAGGSRR